MTLSNRLLESNPYNLQVIETVISWDNCQSAAGKSATTKYAELDTAFTQKLDTGVTDMHSSSGQSLFGVTNQTLSLRRLIAGTNVTLSESSGLITINSSGGSGGSGGITNALTGCSRSSNDLVFTQAVGNNITVGLPIQQSFDVTGLTVSGLTLSLTQTNGTNPTVTLPSPGISNGLTNCSRSSNDLIFTQAVGNNITVGLPIQQSFDVTGLAVSGTTLSLTQTNGSNPTVTLPSPGISNGLTGCSRSSNDLIFTQAVGNNISVGLPLQQSFDCTGLAVSSSNVLSLTQTNGSNPSVTLPNALTGCSRSNNDLIFTQQIGNNFTVGLPIQLSFALTNMTVTGTTLAITQNNGAGVSVSLPTGGITNALTNCSRSNNDLIFTQAVGNNISVGLPLQLSFDCTGLAMSGITLGLTQTNGSNPTVDIYPSLTNNANKVLRVNSSANGVEWSDEGELPSTASALGFLYLHANGTKEWKFPQTTTTSTTSNTYGCDYLNTELNAKMTAPSYTSSTGKYLVSNGTAPTWDSTITTAAGALYLNPSVDIIIGTMTQAKKSIKWYSNHNNANDSVSSVLHYGKNHLSSTDELYGEDHVRVGQSTTPYYGYSLHSRMQNGTATDVLQIGKKTAAETASVKVTGQLETTTGLKFSDGSVQSKGVPNPATAGHVLSAGAGGSWSWAAPSGGGPSWTNVNVSSNSFAQNLGIGQGDRRATWIIEDGNFWLWESTSRMTNPLMNALGHAQYAVANDNGYHVRNYGFFVVYPVANEAYNFTKMYLNGYSTTQTATNFIVEGSNDKHQWTVLHTCTGTHTVTSSSSYNYTSSGTHPTYEYALSTGSNYYHYWRLRMTNGGYPSAGNSITQTYQYWGLYELMFS